MKNSKLSQLLAKLETMPTENDQNELIVLDERCEYVKAFNGGLNSSCYNGTCTGSGDSGCTNGSCPSPGNRGCGVL